jgi:predicted RNA-binding protein with PIN domain
LPEALLVPLVDTAADVLRALDAADVPASLRPLAEFDRRGLTRGAARQQLLRTIETEDAFRDLAVERFRQRSEVAAALETWDADAALRLVGEAAERADLPLLASALYAARPPGWAFGLGVAYAAFERQQTDQLESDEVKARETQIAGMAESRRRADAARAAAEQKSERLEKELREERHARRAREAQAAQDVSTAERQVDEVEQELVNARTALEAAEARLRREAERAREAEEELRDLRRASKGAGHAPDADEPDAPTGLPVLRAEDLRALIDAAELAGRLATGLSGVAEQAGRVLRPQAQSEPPPATPDAGPRERTRRARAHVPPGMVEDDPKALDAMLRTPQAALVVDGYNVSMLAWGEASPAQQRDRLLAAIGELQLRTRARVILVFDGADVEGVRPPRRPGVSVVFSPAGEEADAVVVRQAAELPAETPVIVASSDNWVAEHARKADAHVVSSETLLRALRR